MAWPPNSCGAKKVAASSQSAKKIEPSNPVDVFIQTEKMPCNSSALRSLGVEPSPPIESRQTPLRHGAVSRENSVIEADSEESDA